MKIKSIYTHTSGVEYVKDLYAGLKVKRGSNSRKVRAFMLIKRDNYNLDFNTLQMVIKRDCGVHIGFRQLIEYENCKYELNINQKSALAKVLGLEVEDLDKIVDY